MDGLCAGVAAIAALFFAIFALLSGQVLVSTLAAAVMGAALGFLRWNFNPAKIFMGDGGAMFLGFLMATLALKLRMTGVSRAADWLVPMLVLGVPIFDTALVTSLARAADCCRSPLRQGPYRASPRQLRVGTRLAVLSLY